MMPPGERSTRARIGALAMHGQGKTNTTAATAASMGRFEKLALEDALAQGQAIDGVEIARRAGYLRRSYMSTLSLKASQARRRKQTTS